MKELKDKRLLALGDKLQVIDYLMVNKPKEYLREFGSEEAAKKKWSKHYPKWIKAQREIFVEVVESCTLDELEILEKAVWEIYKKRNLGKLNEKIGIRTVEV